MTGPAIAETDVDLFAEENLVDPFIHYQNLRDAGPVVRLGKYDFYAISRFADVQQALRSPDTLISGEGVGFSDAFNAPKGMNLIQSDGELHRRLRQVVTKPLTPVALKSIRPDLKALITGQIAALIDGGEFDAMDKIARFLPVEAVSHFVGLPQAGREHMLRWANAAFNAVGPDVSGEDAANLREAFAYMQSLSADAVAPGSWAGKLFEAAQSGRLTMQEALAATSAYVIPSLDSTILAKGHLLYNLASHPDEWAKVKANPDLIPSAVLESLRYTSPVRWFSRFSAADHDCDGQIIPAGKRVMILYASANRDERHYAEPARFDVTRDARDHLAWGSGPHLCAGMHLARFELEVLLEALVEADARLTSGEPVMGTNRGLYGYAALPYRIDRA